MLIFSRRVGEAIVVDDQITITVVRVAHGAVRIGIEAPRDVMIVREELMDASDEPTEAPATHPNLAK